jgi:hypothetical protein
LPPKSEFQQVFHNQKYLISCGFWWRRELAFGNKLWIHHISTMHFTQPAKGGSLTSSIGASKGNLVILCCQS